VTVKMEEYVPYYESYSRSRSHSPNIRKSVERARSGSPPIRNSPVGVRSVSPPVSRRSVSPPHKPSPSIEVTDDTFKNLKNREKRSYNKRMRERNLLSEKHLIDLMQELLAEVRLFFSSRYPHLLLLIPLLAYRVSSD